MNRIIKTAKGSEFNIDFNEKGIQEHFLSESSYADFVLNQINSGIYSRSLEGDNLVIVDLGANIGPFSVHAHDVAKSIYSFEPTPQHFDLLKRMTKTLPNIFPVNAAMTDKDGLIPFYTTAANSTMNNVTTKYQGSTEISVKSVSLKSFIKESQLPHIDFIKCDIEGGEMLVLSQETISDTSHVVAKWFVEIHSTWESKRISRLINLFLYKFRMGSCVHKLNLRSVNKNREILSSRFKSAGYEVTLEDAYTIIATR